MDAVDREPEHPRSRPADPGGDIKWWRAWHGVAGGYPAALSLCFRNPNLGWQLLVDQASGSNKSRSILSECPRENGEKWRRVLKSSVNGGCGFAHGTRFAVPLDLNPPPAKGSGWTASTFYIPMRVRLGRSLITVDRVQHSGQKTRGGTVSLFLFLGGGLIVV